MDYGPSSLERAVVTVLIPERAGLLPWGQLNVDNLVGWGVLVAEAQRRVNLHRLPTQALGIIWATSMSFVNG